MLCGLPTNWRKYNLAEAKLENPEDPGMELTDHVNSSLILPATKGIHQSFPTRKHGEITDKRTEDVSKENYSFYISPLT